MQFHIIVNNAASYATAFISGCVTLISSTAGCIISFLSIFPVFLVSWITFPAVFVLISCSQKDSEVNSEQG